MNDTYIVAADPPRSMSLGRMLVQSVVVSAGQNAAVGTVVLP